MLRSWMILILALFCSGSVWADSTSWDNTGFGEIEPEPKPVQKQVPNAKAAFSGPKTVNTPGVGVPAPAIKADLDFLKYTPGPFEQRQCAKFNGRLPSAAPIWTKFLHTFKQCAPGCVPGVNNTFGCRGCRSSGKKSCHEGNGGGHAIDINFIQCGGNRYEASKDKEFNKFFNCMDNKKYDGNERSVKKKWVGIYQESTGSCAGVNLSSRKKTVCHWDHAHFDLGCTERCR